MAARAIPLGGSKPLLTPAATRTSRNIVSRTGGAIALVLGVSTLLGWILDISILKTTLPGVVGMVPNAAICFVLLGTSLLAHRVAAVLATSAVAAIAVLTLAEHLGLKIGIDQLFFRDDAPLRASAPGRIVLQMTVAFLLIAVALLLAHHAGRWAVAGQVTAMGAGTIAWLAAVGYMSGAKGLYGLPGRAPVALDAALGLIVVVVGGLALRPDVGVVRALTSKTARGSLFRKLALLLILGPALLSWTRHLSVHGNGYAGQWLFVSCLVGLLVVALVTTTRTVGRTETGRDAAEATRHAHERNLETFFTLSTDLLCVADFDGFFRRVNSAWEQTLGWTVEEMTDKVFLDFVHPDDHHVTHEAVAELSTGAGVELENRQRCKDGSYRWIGWMTLGDPERNLIYATGRDISERKHTEETLREAAEELEERFVARTADLSAANEELEAFAYSVSHDLQAPLRGIDGFSQAVLEEYSESLDETGRDYLIRLRSASQRMGHLIDDMLSLSRISRVELSKEQVDLSAIATSLAVELQEREPGREVAFVIGDGLTAQGDFRFLSIILENLLANAFKFTSTRASARIEFGREAVEGGEDAYFVRDDGVGFDMTYSDQLFVPFQRLHTEAEFPGSGIGLATIRRIVARHGGRTWAHGELDRGATVYFTLGAT